MLEILDVSTYYGRIEALKNVSLQVNPGEMVAIIGANGAGKTTLLNTICGLHHPRHGQMTFQGQKCAHLAAEQMVSLGISHVPERRQVFSSMSVLDNLLLGAYHRRQNKQAVQQDIEYVYKVFPRLKERQKQMAGTLSGGEQQMLAIGRGLMARPKLMLLDEPSLGLAPLLVRELMLVVGQLRDEGMTVLLVEQNARAALSVADRGYVLETGKVVLSGTAQELMANPGVQKAYLGKGAKTEAGGCHRDMGEMACLKDTTITSCILCTFKKDQKGT